MNSNELKGFDIVVVPFPFTDKKAMKRRPALVLSSNKKFHSSTGHVVLSMITSAKNSEWELDSPIKDLDSAGLPSESVVRMKLFSIDSRFILRKLGKLSRRDSLSVKAKISKLISL